MDLCRDFQPVSWLDQTLQPLLTFSIFCNCLKVGKNVSETTFYHYSYYLIIYTGWKWILNSWTSFESQLITTQLLCLQGTTPSELSLVSQLMYMALNITGGETHKIIRGRPLSLAQGPCFFWKLVPRDQLHHAAGESNVNRQYTHVQNLQSLQIKHIKI